MPTPRLGRPPLTTETRLVTLRLDKVLADYLEEQAQKKGLTLPVYAKTLLIKQVEQDKKS